MNCSKISDAEFQNIINKSRILINSGSTLSISIYSGGKKINMISTNLSQYSSTDTKSWKEGGGHAIFITAVGEDCLYVSSWGREYKIPFSDLKNGGEFCLYESKIN